MELNNLQEENKQNFHIIIISGYATHGKSEFITQCKDYPKYEVLELSTIDWPKQVLMYAGWDGKEKTDKVRKALSRFKWVLEDFDGSPSNKVIEFISKLKNMGVKNYIFFVNIREPQKIDEFKVKIKDTFGLNCSTLFISNPNKPIIKTNSSDSHTTQYKYDTYIANDGTLEDLKAKGHEYLDSILGGTNEIH